ncbi:MAG: Na+/H+ antiporter subunit E [Rhizobiales bacterium]|nr:Na+/H+ antiporter subunit E [Hyphomicrobiales bacterium]
MTPFVINLALAAGWSALFSAFTLSSLATGFAVGYAILWLLSPLFPESRYCRRLADVVRLTLYFLWELLVSSLQVAWDVLTPMQRSRPGIVAVPIEAKTDLEITALANLVSLTPGTLSLDVSPDRKTLYVHAMFVDDPESIRRDIQNGMERRVLEALR